MNHSAAAPQLDLEIIEVVFKQGGKILHQSEHSSLPIVCGRSPECHISLPEFNHFSRNHFVITQSQNEFTVTDLESRYGIMQNGRRLVDIKFQDEVTFKIINIDVTVKYKSATSLNLSPVKTSVQDDVATVVRPNPMPKTLEPALKRVESASFGEQNKEEIFFDTKKDLSLFKIDQIKLQCVLMWEGDVLEVLNFSMGQKIVVGPKDGDTIYLPVLDNSISLGRFLNNGADIKLHKDMAFKFFKEDWEMSLGDLLKLNKVTEAGNNYHFFLEPGDNMDIPINTNFSLKLGFVMNPRPFIMKRWIENREEIKRAITTSIIIHAVLTVVVLLLTPKNDAPKIENVPHRFARLLVEPPKAIFTPPPVEIKPIEEPPPPPLPKTEPKPEPKPEPPKPKPKPEPPKMMVKKEMQVPKKPAPKKPKPPEPQAEDIADQRATIPKQISKTSLVKEPPPVNKEAQEMADLFGAMPTPGGSTGKSSDAPIKISKTGRPGAAALPKPTIGKPGSGAGSSGLEFNPSVGIKIGGQGYAGPAGKSAAGKRKIEGAVIGTPSLKPTKTEQGLTNAEVMKIVNSALSKVQQCYERELFNDPNLAGRVEYEWEINPSGSVIDISVKRAEMSKADKLNSCVMGVIKGLKFPKAKNGQNTLATIGFPFGKQ